MKFRIIAISCLIILSFVTTGYCVDNNWGNTDLYPLLGKLMPKYLQYNGVNMGGTSTIVSTVSPLAAANLNFSIIGITSGKSKTMGIAAGEAGQQITIYMTSVTDSGTLTISKTGGAVVATTGWNTIALDATGDSVTLLWVDSTIGWIIVGQYSVTVT